MKSESTRHYPERPGEVWIGHDMSRGRGLPVGAQHILPVGVGRVLKGGNSIVSFFGLSLTLPQLICGQIISELMREVSRTK